jgi:hypothetical protein
MKDTMTDPINLNHLRAQIHGTVSTYVRSDFVAALIDAAEAAIESERILDQPGLRPGMLPPTAELKKARDRLRDALARFTTGDPA